MTFTEFRTHPDLLGLLPHMRQPETQVVWNTVSKVLDGEPLTEAELAIFRERTGLEHPRQSYRELVIRVGRQAGKSRWIADRAVFKAVSAPKDGSARGRYVVIVAQDSRAAMRAVFNYVLEALDGSAALSKEVVSRTTTTVTLANGVVIAVYPCRPAALRGIRAIAVYIDEFAHFRASDGNPIDTAMKRACRPLVAMTGGEIVFVSSPYAAAGEFYNLDRQYRGKDGSTLVFFGGALDFNPLLPADYIEKTRQEDPEAALSEIDGEFLTGTSTLFDPLVLEACVADHRELLPAPGVAYRVGVDVSGGQRDAAALAVSHAEHNRVVIDAIRAWPAPHNPESVLAEMAAVAKSYGCHSVSGDRYAGQFPAQIMARHGIHYELSPLDRSALYLQLSPRVLSGSIDLPNDPALLRELRGLERRRGFGGKDRVDHRGGAHDDRANAVALASYLSAVPGVTPGTIEIIGF